MKSTDWTCAFSRKFTIAIVLVITIRAKQASARPSLTITPRTAHVSNEDVVTVMCASDRRLVGCQFHLNSDGSYVMDFSGGVGSTEDRYHSWYHGTGLAAGHCGMKMKRPQLSGLYVLGCRVRSEIGGWVYADMTLYVYSRGKSRTEPFELMENYPDKVIVLPGEQLRVAYTLKSPINDRSATCSFEVQGMMRSIDSKKADYGLEETFKTFGHASSQCGIEIPHVKEEYNGWLWGNVKTSYKEDRYPFPKITLIVAEAPAYADISLNITSHQSLNVRTDSESRSATFEEGDTLSASCQATNSRPASNITWHFGQDVIRNDNDDDSPITNEWIWDYEKQSIMQNISRKLSWQDDGKELVCQITHVGMDDEEGMNETIYIKVNIAKSNHIAKKLTQGDFTVGYAGELVVDTDHWTINRPTFIWQVKNITIREDDSDTGNYHFRPLRSQQKDGKWIARMLIYSVYNEDDKHPYLLIAGDDNERREYIVNITVVDLKVRYFLVTLFSGVAVVLLAASLIYYKDLRHWYMNSTRNKGGRISYNSGRITYSPARRIGEQGF